MQVYLELFLLLPLSGFITSLFIPNKSERLISSVALFTIGVHLLGALAFIAMYALSGFPTLNLKDAALFRSAGYEYYLDFVFDKITAVYLLVGSFLSFLVVKYSRYYLHREEGFKRFFSTVLFFFFGYNITIFSGNFETLFVGWEILGLSSFLLIAFYRRRYLPVKNALKVFSVYRMGDVGILLAMWMSHHLWHENITFAKISNYGLVHDQLQAHSAVGIFISLMILLAAAVKSAQLPFSSWLPRAMEGPTPSTAIFYGSLSVHMGVFLLLRTFPFWEHQFSVRILICLLGLTTSLITTGIARVQSSVKSQIAYASISQIGIIFIEVAAGFENLALLHFAGNAILRTYQLLVSPSVVSYLIREQFYARATGRSFSDKLIPKKIATAFYMMCLKEWNLDSLMYKLLWNPLKFLGQKLNFITVDRIILFFIPLYLLGLLLTYNPSYVPKLIHPYLPVILSFTGLVMVFKAFSERKNVKLSWLLVIMNHLWVALAISFNEDFPFNQIHIYLSGILVAGITGYLCLRKLRKTEKHVGLSQFHGYQQKHPIIAAAFFLSCLGMAGFPITPTFIGEDLIFTHIHENQVILAFLVSTGFVLNGLTVIRIYARVFLGPHVKSQYELTYRSS
jgi:NADH:ubiquinone oxidoreductase subunit 5 (subunit L)/multisubunit Na+/H+ antiporter MnhA subunit